MRLLDVSVKLFSYNATATIYYIELQPTADLI